VGIAVKTLGGIFKLYETSLCHNHTIVTLLSVVGYYPNNVQVIYCEHDGASLWLISPATLKSFQIHSIDPHDFLFSCW